MRLGVAGEGRWRWQGRRGEVGGGRGEEVRLGVAREGRWGWQGRRGEVGGGRGGKVRLGVAGEGRWGSQGRRGDAGVGLAGHLCRMTSWGVLARLGPCCTRHLKKPGGNKMG